MVELVDVAKHMENHHDMQTTSWIRSNIHMRECTRFTEILHKDTTLDDPKCQCGKTKSDHKDMYSGNPNPGTRWKMETHTQVCRTNAFGEIKFVGSAGCGERHSKFAKFVRVDQKTDPKTLLHMIYKQWNLCEPLLLISVTGGVRNFNMKGRLKDVFRKGLVKAALSTGAWIITGGWNSGFMRHVGEGVREYAIVAGDSAAANVIIIGIAPWGLLDQKESLIHPEGKWPATYRMDNPNPLGFQPEPNHTHFILVDDGSTNMFGGELMLRRKLEKEISTQKVTEDNDETLTVPSVRVVVGGGPNTIMEVFEAIKHGTPTLIIAGSGRAADILAYAFKNATSVTKTIADKNGTTQQETSKVFSESVLVNIAEKIKNAFNEKHLEVHLTQIKECIKYPDLINVYELDGQGWVSSGIDNAILTALLKAKNVSVLVQLKLALLWNRVDVAQTEIFTDDKNWKKGELDNSVRYAIEHNLPEFLDLFIEKGVSLEDYLTELELTRLYNKIKSSTLLYGLLFKQSKISEGRATLYDVGKIVQALTMDTYQPLYLTEQADQSQSQFNPIRELFIFSILLNRKKMAYLLWKRIDEPIPAALTASKMLKAMASKEDDLDQKENMMQHARQYEELAIGVLNECYDQNEERTLIMMTRDLPNWGSTTCLTMAVQAQNRKFIAQSAVQNLLTQIWMGKISDENSYWKLWLCMFCPPLVNLAVSFREELVMSKSVEPGRDQQEGHGIPKNGVSKYMAIPNVRRRKHCDYTAVDGNRDSDKRLIWPQKLKFFYNAPITKFRFYVLAHFAFLILFSYIILTDFNPPPISWKEWLLIAWVATLYPEEFRQIAQGESKRWKHRFLHWISDYWNMVDVAKLLLFGIGLGLRFSPLPIGTARIVLALDLMIFYMKLLQCFSVSKNLGPKLIMIARMMVDLLFFVCILTVFLIGYGVASYAIMFPNQSDPKKILTGIFYQAFFQMYGELFLEDIGVEGCTDNQTLNAINDIECPEYPWMGILLLCIYMMLSNVLLLNLLIAMFSYTFTNVQVNTDELWKFQRYEVINEFFRRPPIPPPFIIISHCLFFFRFVLKKCCRRCLVASSSGKLKQYLSPNEERHFVLWEATNADNFIKKQTQKGKESVEEKINVTSKRVHSNAVIMDKLLNVAETIGRVIGRGEGKCVDERLTRIENQLDRTNKAIDWIIASMVENKLGAKADPPQLQPVNDWEEIEDAVADDYDVPSTIEKLYIAIHVKSRTSPYPGTAMRRFHVADSKVKWNVNFPEYKPVSYTHKSVLDMPYWADKDLMSISKERKPILLFNSEDPVCQYNRVSHMGTYEVLDGLPLNPKGRTGMIGRGTLGRFGPNHAANPIVTRWERKQDGGIRKEDNKPMLEFIAIQRRDNQQWAIPEGMVKPGHQISQTLLRVFRKEALRELDKKTEEERSVLREKIQELLKPGTEIYKGYVDDPRNTDNAWMETVAVNFHDETGLDFAQLDEILQAGDDVQDVGWQSVSSKIPLFSSHMAILSKVAEIHRSAF